MPPLIALFLCIVFVLYLFRTDGNKTETVSRVVWLPAIWLMYGASRSLVYWFGAGVIISDSGSTAERASLIDPLFLSVLISLAFTALVRRRIDWALVFRRNRWLIALYSYALISVAWSDVPFSSFKQFVRLAGGVLMALVILTEQSPRQALEAVFQRVVYILIPISLLLIKYFPDLGVAYRAHSGGKSWIGVTMTKNQLGVLCMMSVLFLVWKLVTLRQNQRSRRRPIEVGLYWLVMSLSLFMMFGEGVYSATALACLPAGITTLFLLRWAQKQRLRLSVKVFLVPITAIFLVGGSLPFLGTSPVAGVSGLLGRDATLTERTSIWEVIRPFASEAPLLGHGYSGFWTQKVVEMVTVNEAHNGYLEVILILGVVGLILLFGFVVSYCTQVCRSLSLDRDVDWAIFGFCLVVMLVLHEASEASFLAGTDLLWTSLIFVSTNYRSIEVPEISVWEGCAMDCARLGEIAWAGTGPTAKAIHPGEASQA